MKHFLLGTLLLTGASGLVHAQTVRLGLRAGLNATSASLQNNDQLRTIVAAAAPTGTPVKTTPVAGYQAGLLLNVGGPKISVQAEGLFSQYRTRYQGGAGNFADVTTQSIEVPVLVKYTFSRPSVKYFVNAGPYINYSLNGRINVSNGYFTIPETVRFEPKSNRLAYGLTGGVGAMLPLGPGDLLVEARLNYALRSRISQFSTTSDHLKTGMLSVGYLFRFGR